MLNHIAVFDGWLSLFLLQKGFSRLTILSMTVVLMATWEALSR